MTLFLLSARRGFLRFARTGSPCFCAFALIVAGAWTTCAETVTLDLVTWETNVLVKDGWTLSEMKKYSSGTLRGAAYFPKVGAFVCSPQFSRPILQVSVESATSRTNLSREVTVFCCADGRPVSSMPLKRPIDATFAEERIELSQRDGISSVVIKSTGGNGNWAIRRISVVYGEYIPAVIPVAGVIAEGKDEDRFRIAWNPVEEAVGYVVGIWTNGNMSARWESVVSNNVFECSARAVRYGYSVRARFNIGGAIVDSGAVTGAVDMANSPWSKRWKLSGFLPKPGMRKADFDCLGKITKKTDWVNGVDVDGVHAFKDEGPATVIRPTTPVSVYADLYCFNAGTEDSPTNGLALLGSKSTGLRLVLPIRLDADRGLSDLSVAYDVCEVNAGGTNVATQMSFAWAVANDLTGFDDARLQWQDAVEGAYASGDKATCRIVRLPTKPLRSAAHLLLSWRVPRQPNSAMIGLSNVRVFGAFREGGCILTIL